MVIGRRGGSEVGRISVVDAKRLLEDLKRFVKRLEDDLRERANSVSEMADRLEVEYRSAKEAGRTGDSFEAWREGILTQAAVAWILGCVFMRFMEDNGLVDDPLIAGPGERRTRASDRQTLYFQSHPTDTDRDYLYDVFRTVAGLPAVAKLYDEGHNPLWVYGVSGDAAKELIAFWRQVVPETGELIHDFTDADWNTRFLGDLYQDLSEAARKRYALLQTPEFVEEFILDRTLDPAIEEFGLKEVRLIDPTCGSGHFLLGAFRRLLDRWFEKEPGTPERELVQRALDGVYGVDINSYATAIARFRLLVEVLKASRIDRLKEAPGYRINVTAGDSLLHGRRFGELDLGSGADQISGKGGIGHAFLVEDLDEINRVLGQQYHVVIGNPPYITAKDKALNQLYRARYHTCHRKYALSVPFAERFFELAVHGNSAAPAGYVGMITANSFMKREFGKKLVEEFLPNVDLTHVLDTSGAYIPGHGTPTVILFGRARNPVSAEVRAVMGIMAEPGTPDDPANGLVWSSIRRQIDQTGSEDEYVSVTDVNRVTFNKHPWSIGGGGATELKELVEGTSTRLLSDVVAVNGVGCVLGEDEAFGVPKDRTSTTGFPERRKPLVEGLLVRDWALGHETVVAFPYTDDIEFRLTDEIAVWLWPLRTTLWARATFSKETYREAGRSYAEYHQIPIDRNRFDKNIVFAHVATGNHFVLEQGGKLFNRSAPIIQLPKEAEDNAYLELLGFLNCSIACFWMKQVFYPKAGSGMGRGIQPEEWMERYDFDGTKLKRFPIPGGVVLDLSQKLDECGRERQSRLPDRLAARLPLERAELDEQRILVEQLFRRMIALQEELDWRCYALYGVTDRDLCYRDPPEITFGQRAFEIAMARQMTKRKLETAWFERHRSTPITETPAHWPEDYRQLVERRIALIESDRYIGLIERPEYKRRWNQESWEEQETRALQGWLFDRLEHDRYWPEPHLQSARSLAARAETDADFIQVAELYVGHPGFDVAALVAELVGSESVPFLPILRYKASGLRKREIWEKTWQLQRQEDATDAQVAAELTRVGGETDEEYQSRLESEQRNRKKTEVGDIATPPKYRSADFITNGHWRLRGPLDVPKERFVSYPHCSRENDPSLVVGWAGWDHLQQAQALASYYTEMVEQEGWQAERLKPLLAGIGELLPWLKQWHNDIDPTFNERMGDFFETFLRSELQKHGLTREDLAAWEPPATRTRRGRRA